MRQEFLALEPAAYVCPYCGGIHEWKTWKKKKVENENGKLETKLEYVSAGTLLNCTLTTGFYCSKADRHIEYCLNLIDGSFCHEVLTTFKHRIFNSSLFKMGEKNEIIFMANLGVNEDVNPNSISTFGFVFMGEEAVKINSITEKEDMLINLINNMQKVQEIEQISSTIRNLNMDSNIDVMNALNKKVAKLLKK